MTHPLPASSSTSTLGLLVVIGAAASISVSNILTPMVYALGTNSLTLLGLRYAGFLLVCGLWLKTQGISISLQKSDLIHCAGAGTAYAFGSACLITSFAFIPVSLAILVFYLFPLITRLAESAIDRRVPSVFEIVCYILALSGLAVCLGVGLDDLNIEGLLFAVLAALGLSLSYVWTGRRLKSVQPVVLTFTMAATGLVLSIIATTVSGNWAMPPLDPLALLIVGATILTFAGAFLGMFVGVNLTGPSRTAMVMNLEPVMTVGLAIVILEEGLEGNQLLGAVLVIATIVATQLKAPQSGS